MILNLIVKLTLVLKNFQHIVEYNLYGHYQVYKGIIEHEQPIKVVIGVIGIN